jgi:hypothetical protein
MEVQLRIVESQLIPAAGAMPANRYSFAPTTGEYKEVRTFALQRKHVATANFVFYSAILGQDPPLGATLSGTTNGPADIKTKEQILKYLRDSFALGQKAFATPYGGECGDSPRQTANSICEYAIGDGEIQLYARIGSLWANRGISTDD